MSPAAPTDWSPMKSERMAISENEAITIAKEFVQASRPANAWPTVIEPHNVRLDRGGFPTDVLGLGEEYWSMIFDLDVPDDLVLTPDFCIVLVDAKTGSPAWFPVM